MDFLLTASYAISANENSRQTEITDEMGNQLVCTVQDLADLLLMQRGKFGKYTTPAKRLQRARELDLIKKGT